MARNQIGYIPSFVINRLNAVVYDGHKESQTVTNTAVGTKVSYVLLLVSLHVRKAYLLNAHIW